MKNNFDIVIVGGGHAGLEAAHISASFGLSVGLFIIPGVKIASAPCNPAIGGVGKGQVVREIDALGGVMGFLADKAGIQYRILNESKGFAVQSTRVQIDKDIYADEAQKLIAENSHITVIREKVLQIQDGADFIIKTEANLFAAKKVIVTTGTFLAGKMHSGKNQTLGGRVGCEQSPGLNNLFEKIKILPQRFKTGTPPRIKRTSINYDLLDKQPTDDKTRNLHYLNQPNKRHSPQVDCYLTYTNPDTLVIIRDNKEQSPMYNGQIQAVGARYCPSIEDKAFRYPDRNTHHVFIEPEGLNLETMYPSGVSTSLPEEVQESFLRTIAGLENCEILVPGYAVEYDVVDTTQLDLTLEYKSIPGLYFAGQVNGTSGYEEAAGQGLMAGINASLSTLGKERLVLNRADSYIGVMLSDLIANTRDEPYRLFTARSENRLSIREDNTIVRMRPYRTKLGLNQAIDEYEIDFLRELDLLLTLATDLTIARTDALVSSYELPEEGKIFSSRISLTELMRQSWLNPVEVLNEVLGKLSLDFNPDVVSCAAISLKYDGYVNKAREQYKKVEQLEKLRINWEEISKSSNISFECKQRIIKIRPETFGQLKLIEGIRPATLALVAGKLY